MVLNQYSKQPSLRGKIQRKPPKRLSIYKKTVNLEEGLTVARLQGELRFKKTQKGMEKSFREHLGKWIDNINPLELTAILGLTFVVKNLLDTVDALKAAIKEQAKGWVVIAPEWPRERWGARKTTPTEFETGITSAVTFFMDMPDWQVWLIAFSIAYIIVKHGGQLLGLMKEGVGTLTTVVGALIGVAA